MAGVFGRTENQRGNSLYLQNDIDQAAVRLALLVVVLMTTALVLRSRMSAKACPEPVEGSHVRF